MKKNQILICVVIALMVSVQLPSSHYASAQITATATLSSSGTILQLSPSPGPTPPSGTNLMSVTDGYWYDDMHWVLAPCSQYNEVISYTSTYNGLPSWQCTLSSNSWGVDWTNSPPIAPGDVIYFSVWIETSAATLSSDIGNQYAGGRIGLDMYGSQGGIGGIENTNGIEQTVTYSTPDNTYVPFGSGWTQVVMNFTVANTYKELGGYNSYPVGQNVAPTACIPWIQVYSDSNGVKEGGTAWFADPTFIITPP